jgi:hypothetical protein
LTFGAADQTVRGLVINRWAGNGLSVPAEGRGARIEGNWIGLDANGTAAAANGNGVATAAADIRIGGSAATQRNVISGNDTVGVLLPGTILFLAKPHYAPARRMID